MDEGANHVGGSGGLPSILELLTLAASPGTELVLSATGADSQEALDAVASLFASDLQAC